MTAFLREDFMTSYLRSIPVVASLGAFVFFASAPAMAQSFSNGLPADPFAVQQPVQTHNPAPVQQQYTQPGVQAAPTTAPPEQTSPWVGEMTSFGMPKGQDLIAPDVNISNMLTMTGHLRSLGYQIPPEFDTMITNAPASMRTKIMSSLYRIQNSGTDSVVGQTVSTIMRDLEQETGLSVENILGNSLDILAGDKGTNIRADGKPGGLSY